MHGGLVPVERPVEGGETVSDDVDFGAVRDWQAHGKDSRRDACDRAAGADELFTKICAIDRIIGAP